MFKADPFKLAVVHAALLLAGCKESFEAARATSPDGSLDAVTVESDAGATTGYTYKVCVVPHGGQCGESEVIAWLNEASRNKSAWGVDTVWQSSTQLEVRYLEAKAAKLLNPQVLSLSKVKVILRHGMENASAAPGSMFKIPGK